MQGTAEAGQHGIGPAYQAGTEVNKPDPNQTPSQAGSGLLHEVDTARQLFPVKIPKKRTTTAQTGQTGGMAPTGAAHTAAGSGKAEAGSAQQTGLGATGAGQKVGTDGTIPGDTIPGDDTIPDDVDLKVETTKTDAPKKKDWKTSIKDTFKDEDFQKKAKKYTEIALMVLAVATIIGCIAAMPFTGGASALPLMLVLAPILATMLAATVITVVGYKMLIDTLKGEEDKESNNATATVTDNSSTENVEIADNKKLTKTAEEEAAEQAKEKKKSMKSQAMNLLKKVSPVRLTPDSPADSTTE